MAGRQVGSWDENPVLFGADPTPGIVAAEIEPGGERVEIFRREGDRVETEVVAFEPFVLLADRDLLRGFREDVAVDEFAGDHALRWRVRLKSALSLENLKKHLQRKSARSPAALDAPYLYVSDLVQQYLMATGRTQFKKLKFEDLLRLQIDIETYCEAGFEFPNPQREGDRIISIALSTTGGWEHVIFGDKPEAEMLEELNECIRTQDPDVIEGHNLFKFDLAYVQARAKRYGVQLMWGRGGRPLESHPSRMQIGERAISYTRFDVHGRHIVDTFILVQHYDIATRDLESFGLKEVAVHFGVAAEDRVYLAPEDIGRAYKEDPDRLRRYNLDDVRETRKISDILLPGYFVQAQIFPLSFQNTMLRGNATKIDTLFLRAYLQARYSVPLPEPAKPIQGGYTDILFHGVARGVLHCDITSLYPSLMLVFECSPRRDQLGVFPRLLGDLREFRVQAKRREQEARDPADRRHAHALQATFKILINSFYGYLGFEMAHFNDFEQANRVTERGRETITGIMARLQEAGCRLIEVDTDGIYFVPPEKMPVAEQEALLRGIEAALPEGIRLELDGRYPAMLSYKIKNYALLNEKKELLVKGSGLRSRGIELFQRQWMEEMFLLLLHGRRDAVAQLTEDFRTRFKEHRVPVRLFMKTETLQEAPQNYQEKVRAKKRNIAAAYELALSAGRHYQAGDQISYYVTGSGRNVKVHQACKLASTWDPRRPDENTEYYLGKLGELYEKFEPFIRTPDGEPVAVEE
ncbi:MAG: DNA polymerase II [Nitrospirae bacterium]|nr:DNA polymerase II [Nitrospirota bacterium]